MILIAVAVSEPISQRHLVRGAFARRAAFPSMTRFPIKWRYMIESIWWTGKDSNLRTSQGGTDLQSVGFNHSPTCPKTPDTVENNI